MRTQVKTTKSAGKRERPIRDLTLTLTLSNLLVLVLRLIGTLRKRDEFSGPIIERSRAKLKLSRIAFDTQFVKKTTA